MKLIPLTRLCINRLKISLLYIKLGITEQLTVETINTTISTINK
jgi:hypothetical protein